MYNIIYKDKGLINLTENTNQSKQDRSGHHQSPGMHLPYMLPEGDLHAQIAWDKIQLEIV